MQKTPTQEKLEAQRNKDIREILIESLEQYRGKKNLAALVAIDLDVSDGSVYLWCRANNIDIDAYRFGQPEEGSDA